MLWDWLDRFINRRQIREDLRTVDELCEQGTVMLNDLNRRVRESFTPDEWNKVRERCERQLERQVMEASDIRDIPMGMRNFQDDQGDKIVRRNTDADNEANPVWLFSDVHLADAADRITDLINSRPSSPTKDELLDAIKGDKS